MNHLHNYRVINEDSEGIKEICQECKKILYTRKAKNGIINNREYMKEHIRDTAQPYGRTSKIFNKCYVK